MAVKIKTEAPKGISLFSNLFLDKRKTLFFSSGWGTRHTFAFMIFLGFANVFASRIILSLAIVSMVTHTSGTGNETANNIGTECPSSDHFNTEVSSTPDNYRKRH